uniref:transmembrane protein PVRIG isoform X2 n=1 Tax=Jaculus jaculus TaxID=51337 RepID=UPI001E1B2CEA|nr:transmembrane protein PVRIG isoform X2 [Jaculus jaculus]
MAGLWTLVLRWALLNFGDSVDFGVQQWAPAHQARWETQCSVSLTVTVEESQTRSHMTNATFCCEFTVFPDGSHSACGDSLASSDQGLPGPTPASTLRADLAGILGASGVLLFGFIFITYLLRQRRHRSVTKLRPPLAGTQMQTTSQAPLAAPHLPYTTLCPAVLETGAVHLDQLLPWCVPLPTHPAHRPRPGSLAFPPASAHSGFISVENALYDKAGGESLPHTGPNLPLTLCSLPEA